MPLIRTLQDVQQLEKLLLSYNNITAILTENTAPQRVQLNAQIDHLKNALEVVNSMKSYVR